MAPPRIKTKLPATDSSATTPVYRTEGDMLPDIELDDSFRIVIQKLSIYITDAVTLPCTFEQLRTTSAGDKLRTLVTHLSATCENPSIVNALLALKWHYGEANDDRGLSEARANACEIVAWRFLTHLSEREAVEFCLYEIPPTRPRESDGVSAPHASATSDEENADVRRRSSSDERSPLLPATVATTATTATTATANQPSSHRAARKAARNQRNQLFESISRLTMTIASLGDDDDDDDDDPTAPFVTLNALEIAAVADAKRFLSQNVVQKIITGIWNGDIIFWDRLEVHAVKKPRFYNPHTADPFSRLRVPKYLKSFEVFFFLALLTVFYLTLWNSGAMHVSIAEVFFYILFAAFAYDELSEWIDAGSLFYGYDIWNIFDLVMLIIGFVFIILRIIGIYKRDAQLVDTAFDILCLEALFMVPRICSILSLSPYWGTLIPCLKEMTKDFFKFMVLIVIIYLGFLTTFCLLGHDVFTFPAMAMIITKIFFGDSSIGFDIMDDISPFFGPPLMMIFITLSVILLMGSMTGMLSNSFSRVMDHAREEYLYVYSIYVLEASTSNRLMHFYPPLNLVALVLFPPMHLFAPSENNYRAASIALLKATHIPIVALIQFYEYIRGRVHEDTDQYSAITGPRLLSASSSTLLDASHPGKAIATTKKASARPKQHSQNTRPSSSSDIPPSRSAAQVPSGTDTATAAAAAVSALTTVEFPRTTDEDTGMDAPSDIEVRVAELSAKIDKLTELVLQLHAANSSS